MCRPLPAFAVALALASTTVAQGRPDFSGTWVMDEGLSESPAFEGFVGPVTWVIRQAPRQVIVAIHRGPKATTLTFTLFDKPPTGAASGGVPSYRAYWDGDRLVTETAQNIQGQTVTTKETRTLRPDSQQMHVERIVRVEHGYTIKGTQNYGAAKDVFRRVTR